MKTKNHNKWYYIKKEKKFGPYSVDEIYQLYSEKKINSEDQLFKDGPEDGSHSPPNSISVLDLTKSTFDPKTGLLNAFLAIRQDEEVEQHKIVNYQWDFDTLNSNRYNEFFTLKRFFIGLLIFFVFSLYLLMHHLKKIAHAPIEKTPQPIIPTKETPPPSETSVEKTPEPLKTFSPVIDHKKQEMLSPPETPILNKPFPTEPSPEKEENNPNDIDNKFNHDDYPLSAEDFEEFSDSPNHAPNSFRPEEEEQRSPP